MRCAMASRTREEMEAIVEVLGRAHGIKAARRRLRGCALESPGESISRLLIHELGFRGTDLQVEVTAGRSLLIDPTSAGG